MDCFKIKDFSQWRIKFTDITISLQSLNEIAKELVLFERSEFTSFGLNLVTVLSRRCFSFLSNVIKNERIFGAGFWTALVPIKQKNNFLTYSTNLLSTNKYVIMLLLYADVNFIPTFLLKGRISSAVLWSIPINYELNCQWETEASRRSPTCYFGR